MIGEKKFFCFFCFFVFFFQQEELNLKIPEQCSMRYLPGQTQRTIALGLIEWIGISLDFSHLANPKSETNSKRNDRCAGVAPWDVWLRGVPELLVTFRKLSGKREKLSHWARCALDPSHSGCVRCLHILGVALCAQIPLLPCPHPPPPPATPHTGRDRRAAK